MANGFKAAALTSSLLAWIVPGGGHFYLGRRRRAAVFFLVVSGTFLLGILNDGRSYIVDREQPLTYLATLANVATGPIELISRRLTYQEIAYRLPGEETDPRSARLLESMRRKVSQATDEYGTTYLLTAGLMNILLILDAFDIAIGRKV
jgi:TM2 domain-containing membrane protein YozV